jgi:hypothetical protein
MAYKKSGEGGIRTTIYVNTQSGLAVVVSPSVLGSAVKTPITSKIKMCKSSHWNQQQQKVKQHESF